MNKNSRIIPLPVAFIRVPGCYPPKYPGLTLSAPYVICAYLIETPDTTMLFDIGVSADQEGCEWYRPMVLSFDERLSAHGYEVNDIDVIANCHLHCDHAGGNFRFPGIPIYVQSAELAAAGTSGYTVQEACYDFRSAELVHINGRHSLTPDVQLLPTPGHSPGHHSLLVRATPDGNTLLAGQAFDTANEFAAAVLGSTPARRGSGRGISRMAR